MTLLRTPFRGGLALAGLLALALPGGAADDTPKPPTADLPDPVRLAVHNAIQKVYPALVRIHVVTVYYIDGREIKGEAFGSGVIISPDGYVITNHHVVGKARRMQCTLSTRDEVEATLIGSDALADIAIIKLQSDAMGKDKPLPVAPFGDSDKLKVGDRVLAMGSPRALSQSVTMGIVSNREMTLPRTTFGSFRLDGEEVGSLVKWIGHDAQIFPGNSGGPLVSLDGQIVGINDISAGLGGAIPGNLAREIADQLIQYGEVKRSWLGLAVQPLLKSSKLDRGVLVSGVLPDSPAAKAGLKPGDVILSYNGRTFAIRHGEQVPEFNRLVLGTPIGATVSLAYLRDGKEQKASLVTQARGTAEGKEAEFKSWGLTVQEISLLAAKEMQREPYSGVLVTSVRPGAAAAEARPPLQAHDLILDVAGKPVRSLSDLENVTTGVTPKEGKAGPVLVGFERRKQKLLTVVKLGERQTTDRSADASKAWLPVETQVLTKELAEALGLKGKKGVRITQVFPDNTADKAGLKVGDILLRFDEEPIDVSRPEDAEVFPTMVRRHRIGSKVKLDVVRDGKPLTVEVELAASPRSARELVDYHNTRFEFRARDLMFQDRLAQELPPDQKGALVTVVESGGWAALARLHAYDVLLAVDGQPIKSVADLRARMKEVEESKPSRVVFFVRRGVHTMFLELEPAWGTTK
jgi:serine protease Do